MAMPDLQRYPCNVTVVFLSAYSKGLTAAFL